MKISIQLDPKFTLKIAGDRDVPALRALVNQAYKELSDMGLNYTACDQDEEITRQRMQEGRVFILVEKDEMVATILFSAKNEITSKNTAYVGQFAVAPKYKKQKIGTFLMNYCEALAVREGYEGIQLDTAKPAQHLVRWYISQGYKIVGETHWQGKTYDSFIFEKDLSDMNIAPPTKIN